MSDFWKQWNQIDFDALSRNLITSIENGDPRFLAFILAILVFVGSKMVYGQPALRSLGLRAAAAMFLAYGGYLYFYRGAGESNAWIALKAANAAGGVLSLCWIVFPVLNFIFTHIRLALAAFLGYGAYAIATTENFSTDMLPRIALEALMPVGLTLVVAWIVHPIWDYIKALLPKPEPKDDETAADDKKAKKGRPAKQRAERRRRLEEELEDETDELDTMGEDLDVQRVPRDHLDRQRRRDKVRLQVELFYLSAQPDLGGRLSRDMFQDLLHRYLGDHVPVEDVEENAQQLQILLQQQQRLAREALPAVSLEEMTRRLLEDQQRALGYDRPHSKGNGNGSHHPYGHGHGDIAHEGDTKLVE